MVASTTSSVSCGAPSIAPLDHAPHLLELGHEVRLRMEPAGGVDDRHVASSSPSRLDRIECDRRGISTARRADEVRAGALGPDLELLLGGCAKRVRRADEHRAPVLVELARELADRRRLPGAVDAHDEDHAGPRREREGRWIAEERPRPP